MPYANPQGVKVAFAALSGLETSQVHFTARPFELDVPPGVDWADHIPQPDIVTPQPDLEIPQPPLEIPQPDLDGVPQPSLWEEQPPILVPQPDLVETQPDLRVPRPVWDWYRQQYPGLAAEPPTEAAVAAWTEQPAPVVSINPIAAIRDGYAGSEQQRRDLVDMLKAATSYAIGSKIGAELAAANPPTTPEALAAIKAEAKRQASILGGLFFDRYFGWIGAYREGGGPGFLTTVQEDAAAGTTAFLSWPLHPAGLTIPTKPIETVILAGGGKKVLDLFVYFLTPVE